MSQEIKNTSTVEKETPENSKNMEALLTDTLFSLFNVDTVQELANKHKNGTDLERGILGTIIKPNRPLKEVRVLEMPETVKVDKTNKVGAEEDIKIPVGTLIVKYGQSEEDVADLTVYVWKDKNNKMHFRVYVDNIDHEKSMQAGGSNIQSSGNPNFMRMGHVRKSPLGTSATPGKRRRERMNYENS